MHKHYILVGEMGAGKTTLVQTLCKLLGSEDAASSPTFPIVNEYQTPTIPIYHLDLYRLDDFESLINIGIEEYIYEDAYCFIEWPELFLMIPDMVYHKIEIDNLDTSKRIITFS